MSVETNETAQKPTTHDEGGVSESKTAKFLRTSRTVLMPTSVGAAGGSIVGYATLFLDKRGIAATVTIAGGAVLGVLTGTFNAIIDFRDKKIALHAKHLAAEAEGIRLRLAAEASEDRAALVEARRMLADCEREKADLVRRLEVVEASCRELHADMRDMRVAFEGDRRELMAELKAAHVSMREMANEAFRHDGPKGPTP